MDLAEKANGSAPRTDTGLTRPPTPPYDYIRPQHNPYPKSLSLKDRIR